VALLISNISDYFLKYSVMAKSINPIANNFRIIENTSLEMNSKLIMAITPARR